MTLRSNSGTRERGQSMVEFSLVLPVVLLLIFGLLEFGRVINAEITAAHCANELARYGAVAGRTEGDVRNWATDPDNPVCPTFDLAGEGETLIEVDVVFPTGQIGTKGIVVSITYPIEIVVPGLRNLFPASGICPAGWYCAEGRAIAEREATNP